MENKRHPQNSSHLPGQIRYDECLTTLKSEIKDNINEEISGQINIETMLSENAENKTDDIKNNTNKEKELMSETNQQNDKNKVIDGVIYKSLDEVLHDSMIPYTEHVVMDRALPRVEDGLKPVQRRIMYTMLELNLKPDMQYRKSARIVGDCMGKYHPHGDSSVYDAMVRMSQSFSMSQPLVDGHGNFGSIDGDSAAAMRYTEAKLTPLAMELLRDIEKNTVRWTLNFDDSLKEPEILPGRFPNLLVNGAYGIAVGVATNIPPHNLCEVCDAVVAYINKPTIKLEELMKYIKGPDFPTGGQILITDELEQAYRTGKGKIMVRATATIENIGDKQNIIITEMPYQTNKAALLQKIAELKEHNKDKLSAISEIRDESDKNGMRAVIRIKKEGNAKAILEYLFKATGLQVTYGINMVAIADGKPKQMGLLEIISYYVEYQRQVIFRRTKFDLDDCKERAHLLEGLLIAIKNIDEVVKIIKKSATVQEAKQKLKDRFTLSDKQAQAILDMRLARLVNLEMTKILEELKRLTIEIERLTEIYNSKKVQLNVVKEELIVVKKSYKKERSSKIVNSADIVYEEADSEEAFAKDVIIAVTASKTIKIIPQKNYNLAQKEITSTSTLNDVHTVLLPALTTHKVLLFTNLGNVLKTSVGNIAEGKWRDKGVALTALHKNAMPNEFVVNALVVYDEETQNDQEIIFTTTDGMVKKSKLGEYFIAKEFFQGIKLKDNDEVISVGEFIASKTILMISKNGMVLNFESTDIQTTGRTTAGVKGINLDDGDKVVFAKQIDNVGAVTIGSRNGYLKNIPIGEFEIVNRYRKGLRCLPIAITGEVIFAYVGIVPPNIAIKTENSVERVLSKQIAYDSRIGKGKQNFKRKILDMFEYKI